MISAHYGDSLHHLLNLPDGAWNWNWRLLGSVSRVAEGRACLLLNGPQYLWIFELSPLGSRLAAGDSGQLFLNPEDHSFWLDMKVAWPTSVPSLLHPLPRLPVSSAHYADLVHLLQELTTPWFGQKVSHWPGRPVPVRAAAAISGEVDLTECLREAVEIWNSSAPDSLLRWDPQAGWGVRLVHFAGTIRHPALATRMVRLDNAGQPYRVHILAGDNYDHARDRPYAVRGLAHELGHALLLWGHSQDRSHLLWGRAPPQVDRPTVDERRALELWNLLPVGLDLSAYDRSTEMDTVR